jgi:hypothetical protein
MSISPVYSWNVISALHRSLESFNITLPDVGSWPDLTIYKWLTPDSHLLQKPVKHGMNWKNLCRNYCGGIQFPSTIGYVKTLKFVPIFWISELSRCKSVETHEHTSNPHDEYCWLLCIVMYRDLTHFETGYQPTWITEIRITVECPLGQVPCHQVRYHRLSWYWIDTVGLWIQIVDLGQGRYRYWVFKIGRSPDHVGFLSLLLGYCIPLEWWDCNGYK